MTSILRSMSTLAALLLSTSVLAGPVVYDPGPLNFSTENQSMWQGGNAYQLNETYFLGATWNESTTFGSISNFPGTGGTVPNPLHAIWTGAMATCTLVASRSDCINGLNLPGEAFDIIGLGPEPARRLSNPIPAVKTGAEVTLATDGQVGFEFGVKMDSGSVNAEIGYDSVTLTIPDAEAAADLGGVINLNPTANLTGDDLNSQFPTLVLTSGLVFDVAASLDGEACIGGCVEFGASINVDPNLPIVSFNENGEGTIEWFGGNPTIEAILTAGGADLPTGLPQQDVEIAGGLLEADLFLPQPNATYDGTDGTTLFASGQDDLINLTVDIDNVASLIATSGATQNLYGGSESLLGGSVSWDFVDIDFGPALDLRQEFELTPTLMVDLIFSRPVEILGELVTSVTGLDWSSLPDFGFARGDTLVTPTFYLQYGADANTVDFLNELILDINGRLEIDLLSFGINVGQQLPFNLGFFGINKSWALGSVIEEFDIGQLGLFDTRFALGGFNPLQGDSFNVSVAVPEPGSFALLSIGMGMLIWVRRRNLRLARQRQSSSTRG